MSTQDLVRQLPSNSSGVPPLGLPPEAFHPTNDTASHSPDGPVKTVTPVEQFIRVLLLKHGGGAVPKIEAYTSEKWNDESAHFRSDSDWDSWKANVGVYVQSQVDELQSAEQQLMQNRKRWLIDDVPQQVQRLIERARDIRDEVHAKPEFGYRGAIVVPKGHDDVDTYQDETDTIDTAGGVMAEDLVSEFDLDNAVMPSEAGIPLPAPLPVGVFPSHDGGTSQYALFPSCGTVVCGGPYFHKNPSGIMCKHLVYALLKAANESTKNPGLLPLSDGITVPDRARRLVAPPALRRYVPGHY